MQAPSGISLLYAFSYIGMIYNQPAEIPPQVPKRLLARGSFKSWVLHTIMIQFVTHKNLKEKVYKMPIQEALDSDSLFHVSQRATSQELVSV